MKPVRHILITRPEDRAAQTAKDVESAGFIPFTESLLKIVPREVGLPDLDRYQALVFTSAEAVHQFAGRSTLRAHPVYVVGRGTEMAAREAGFENVLCADGDGEALNRLLSKESLDPERPLLHPAGADIAVLISALGLKTDRIVLYKAEKIDFLSERFVSFLDAGAFRAALFFSVRTAEVFVSLIQAYERTEAIKSMKALCIADSVVECLKELTWGDVRVARTPNREGMNALLEDMRTDDRCGE